MTLAAALYGAPARTLEFLCRQASEPELATASRMGGSLVGIPQETVPNRLFEQRDAIIRHLSAGFSPFLNLIMTMAPSKENLGEASGLAMGGGRDGTDNFLYPTHTVSQPMSTLRIAFLDLLVLLIENDAELTILISADQWKILLLGH